MALTQVQGAMVGPTGFANLSGITFPATQVPSADANTLDDYEEGTFTPTVLTGFTSPTYTNQFGRYTKIGRICYFSVLLTVSGGTRNGSQVTINLPFTSNNTSSFAGGAYWAYAGSGVINSTTTNLPVIYIGGNATYCEFYQTDFNSFTGGNFSSAGPSMYFVGWMECAQIIYICQQNI